MRKFGETAVLILTLPMTYSSIINGWAGVAYGTIPTSHPALWNQKFLRPGIFYLRIIERNSS